jgi:hypothetical protein
MGLDRSRRSLSFKEAAFKEAAFKEAAFKRSCVKKKMAPFGAIFCQASVCVVPQ